MPALGGEMNPLYTNKLFWKYSVRKFHTQETAILPSKAVKGFKIIHSSSGSIYNNRWENKVQLDDWLFS